MSYKQLPIYLKPCFLYMGVFPQDEVIITSKLIKLWVVEGFLKPISRKSLEEIAKEYLKDLADRNLVVIHKKKNMKYCKIHDLLRDLSVREAQKERFYSVVTRPTQGIVSGQRRVVISKDEDLNIVSSMSLARSFMWNLQQILPPLDFRLLRILDSCRSMPVVSTEYIENMHQLVNSRYLSIWAPLQCNFPSSIWLFWNLQTLIYHCIEEVTAPTEMWYMPNIRHLDFFSGLRLQDPPNGHDDVVLGNLQTMARVEDFKCGEQVVKRIPNIKKLNICYRGSIDDDKYCLTNLARLDKLESLNCSFLGEIDLSGPDSSSVESLFNFPHSLKKLSLEIHVFQCWQGILDKIGMLPLLEKLQLFCIGFKEKQWKTSEGQFCSLKSLSLHCNTGLALWTTDRSHFPCLELLLLRCVFSLKEIPLDFAEIPTLRMIEVYKCNDSVVESAKRILDEQEELYGEPTIQVEVTLFLGNKAKLESLASPNFRIVRRCK